MQESGIGTDADSDERVIDHGEQAEGSRGIGAVQRHGEICLMTLFTFEAVLCF